jgi:hypothetical protein
VDAVSKAGADVETTGVEAVGVLVGSEVDAGIEAHTVAEGISSCWCAAKLLFRRAMMHVRQRSIEKRTIMRRYNYSDKVNSQNIHDACP